MRSTWYTIVDPFCSVKFFLELFAATNRQMRHLWMKGVQSGCCGYADVRILGFPGLALAKVADAAFACVCLAAAIFVGHFTRPACQDFWAQLPNENVQVQRCDGEKS